MLQYTCSYKILQNNIKIAASARAKRSVHKMKQNKKTKEQLRLKSEIIKQIETIINRNCDSEQFLKELLTTVKQFEKAFHKYKK